MNKDAKIGLVAILALVLLLVIFWGKSTFWRKSDDAELSSQPPSLDAVPTPGSSDVTTVDTAENPADVAPVGDAAPEDQGPITTTADGHNVPPVAITSGPGVVVDSGLPLPTPAVAPVAAASTYVVQKNDTLENIAKKLYNDGTKWKLIAEANKVDPKKLQIGMKLTIPSLDGGAVAPAETTAPIAPAIATAGGQTYVVQKNDRLETIAKKFYNDGTKWKLIAEANKVDPKKLQIGQKLVIPPLPTEVGSLPVIEPSPLVVPAR